MSWVSKVTESDRFKFGKANNCWIICLRKIIAPSYVIQIRSVVSVLSSFILLFILKGECSVMQWIAVARQRVSCLIRLGRSCRYRVPFRHRVPLHRRCCRWHWDVLLAPAKFQAENISLCHYWVVLLRMWLVPCLLATVRIVVEFWWLVDHKIILLHAIVVTVYDLMSN